MATQEFSDYHRQVADLAAKGLSAAAAAPNPARTPGLWLALPAAHLLLADDKSQHAPLADGLHALASAGPAPHFTDPAGHFRDVYNPLVLHLHLAAFARRFESLPLAVWSRCQAALPAVLLPARAVERAGGANIPPDQTALILWQALCVAEASGLESRDVDIELVDALVHAVIAQPGQGGALHIQSPDESLDAWTYRELAGLHALANLALVRRNPAWAKRVESAALYHLDHTQPDHTTNQPWGLFAFLWTAPTRTFAQQQLHDLAAQGSGVPALTASLLLADAADALARFDSPQP